MVDFNVRTYSEDDGRIIGAEVTVISTSGDNLGSISVANAETLAEMQAQLAVIDETYFTEERLEEILENINESKEINATKLSGFVSSDFAKVSQLSAYAPASHTHPVSQITNLYDYQITASSYNVNIDSNVNITVKVTNRATGRPVTGVTVPVLKNNSTWKSGTTGVNGTFSLSYTADTWGLVTFSANNSSIQVKVGGWQSRGTIATGVKLYVNGETRIAMVNGVNLSLPARSAEHSIAEIPSEYAPIEGTVTGTTFSSQNVLVRTDNRAINIYNFNKSITGVSFTIIYPY